MPDHFDELPGETLDIAASSILLPDSNELFLVRKGTAYLFARVTVAGNVSPQIRMIEVQEGEFFPHLANSDSSVEIRVAGTADVEVLAIDSEWLEASGSIDDLSPGLAAFAARLVSVSGPPSGGGGLPRKITSGESVELETDHAVAPEAREPLWLIDRGEGEGAQPSLFTICTRELPVRLEAGRSFEAMDTAAACRSFGLREVEGWIFRKLEELGFQIHSQDNFSFIERVVETVVSDVQVYKQSVENVGRQIGFASDANIQDAAGAFDATCRRVILEMGVKPDHVIRYSEQSSRSMVEQFARGAGVQYRQVSMETGWDKLNYGHLLAWSDGGENPVALIRTRKGYVAYVFDNAGQSREVPVTDEFVKTIGPMAVTFYPSLPNRPLVWRDLAGLAFKGSRGDLLLTLLTTFMISILGATTPVFVAMITGTVIPLADRYIMYFIGGALLLAAIFTAIIGVVTGLAYLRIETRSSYFALAALVDRTLKLPAVFFRDSTAGDMTQRLMAIEVIRTKITQGTLQVAVTFISGFSYLALMFVYEATLALLGLALVGILLLTMAVLGILLSKREYIMSVARGDLDSAALEMLSGVRQARIQGSLTRALTRVFSRLGTMARETYISQTLAALLMLITRVYPSLATAIIFAFYTYRQVSGSGTPLAAPDFLAFYTALGAFFAATTSIGTLFATITAVVPMYQRLRPIMEADPDIPESALDPGTLSGKIEIKDLVFGYDPSQAPLLKGVNLRAEPGECIALVGKTGCGKSTLAKLILGLEKPQAGTILFDDIPLENVDASLVRSQFGVVMQSNQLMPGPIRHTILGTSSDQPLEVAWEAAKLAQVDKDIEAMPMGMSTMISPHAVSAGQAQRLLIARALVGNPRIMIFDEATSSLDSDSQAAISNSIMSLGSTRVIIAHRLSTIKDADRIYVLKDGSVVQSGTFDDLCSSPGYFRELVEAQIL